MKSGEPRLLKTYRYFKMIYLYSMVFFFLFFMYLILQIFHEFELLTAALLVGSLCINIFLLKNWSKLQWYMQIFPDRISMKYQEEVQKHFFKDMLSFRMIHSPLSGRPLLFKIQMAGGKKLYFWNYRRRPDYLLEGFYKARPDLLSKEAYEFYLQKLVRFDHVIAFLTDSKWDRMITGFFPLAFFILSWLYANFVESSGLILSAVSLFFASLVLVSMANTVGGYVVLKRFRIGVSVDKIRDLGMEANLRKYLVLSYGGIFLSVCCLQFFLVQIEHTAYMARTGKETDKFSIQEVQQASKNFYQKEENKKQQID